MQVADHFRQLAQTSLDQESTRLSDGLSDTFHILQFQNDLIAAQLSQLDARIDYQLGLAALYKAMGTNLARDGVLLRLPAPPAGSIPVASD
jgi:outer membrane protein TolC